jgi:hypothetical protein
MKRQIIASLNEICNELETLQMHKEANELTNVMKKIAGRGDRATVKMHNGRPVIHVTDADGKERTYFHPKGMPGFKNLQHAINYAKRIDQNAEVLEHRPRKVGPTGKPWTRDDQEMMDFEASREDKY